MSKEQIKNTKTDFNINSQFQMEEIITVMKKLTLKDKSPVKSLST